MRIFRYSGRFSVSTQLLLKRSCCIHWLVNIYLFCYMVLKPAHSKKKQICTRSILS